MCLPISENVLRSYIFKDLGFRIMLLLFSVILSENAPDSPLFAVTLHRLSRYKTYNYVQNVAAVQLHFFEARRKGVYCCVLKYIILKEKIAL